MKEETIKKQIQGRKQSAKSELSSLSLEKDTRLHGIKEGKILAYDDCLNLICLSEELPQPTQSGLNIDEVIKWLNERIEHYEALERLKAILPSDRNYFDCFKSMKDFILSLPTTPTQSDVCTYCPICGAEQGKQPHSDICNYSEFETISPTQGKTEKETDAVGFAEWINNSGYCDVYSEELKRGAWINSKECPIYTHGSDYHYTELVKHHGVSTNNLYEIYTSSKEQKG